MKKYYLLVLVPLLVVSCGLLSFGTPWVENTSELHNVHFDTPEDWVIEELNDTINIGSSEETLISGIEQGAGASITPATIDDFNGLSDPVEILGLFKGFFEDGRENLLITAEPAAVSINDQTGASMAYEGSIRDQAGNFGVTVITKDNIVVLVLTVDGSERGNYAKQLEQFTHSIVIGTSP
jgi:hypothetical protein